jgi:hypothetical protein
MLSPEFRDRHQSMPTGKDFNKLPSHSSSVIRWFLHEVWWHRFLSGPVMQVANMFDILVFANWEVRSLVAFASSFCNNAPGSIVSFQYEGVFSAFIAAALEMPGRHTRWAAD